MGLPLIDSTSGVFVDGTTPGSDDLTTVLTGSTNVVAGDISGGKGSEVAFNLVDRIQTAVAAYNAGHDTDLANITATVGNTVSGDTITKTYVLSFKLDVGQLDVTAE
jgi:hypothetical protein